MADLLADLTSALAGNYRIERELGAGGMAHVFLATDLKHDRRVAIKVLKPDIAAAVGAERFLREITIAARLSHPNILPLHDSGEAGGLLYYIMPFVDGESLRDKLRREGRLSLQETLRVAGEVADALSHAHAQGLVHRDIKPENILLQAGHALVADFGIARATSATDSTRLTMTGLAVGTPAYMSPEQALGSAVDSRSDVYSLGCLVYEMLAGVPPFRGPTAQAIVAGHATEPVPSLRANGVRVPAVIETALRAALAKSPSERVATPGAFVEALAGARVPLTQRERRRRLRNAIIGLVLVGGVAGAAWAGRRLLDARPELAITSLAVLPLENRTADSTREFLVAGVHEAVIDELARLSGLRVISRTSTLGYRGSTKPLPVIARELGVDAIVEGAVLQARDSVSVRVRLVRANPEERQLSAESYTRDMSGILTLYADVASAVARGIGLSLTPEEQERPASFRQVNPGAYQAYLRGKFHWLKLTPADMDSAQHYYELALKRDPAYALPHSGIAEVWIGREQMGLVAPAEAAPRARAAAMEALKADSTLAEGYFALAQIWTQGYEWQRADSAFMRSLRLRPSYAEAHIFRSLLLNVLGRSAEAHASAERALALDPLNPLFHSLNALNLLREGRWDDAVAEARVALVAVPDHPVALYAMWIAQAQRGALAEAADAAARYLAATAQGEAGAAINAGFAANGFPEAMRRGAVVLADRSRSNVVTATDVAALFALAGDRREALDWLERAFSARDPSVIYIAWPPFPRLSGEPGYAALLRRLRLAG